MNFKTNLPEIATLRNRVKEKAQLPLDTHFHFIQLVAELEKELHEHMSETTLERVWGYSTRGYDTVSLRTLDVLSMYGTGCLWAKFCEELAAECESELFNVERVVSADLAIGDRVRIGWLPDRVCEVRYLGNNRFVAERCENSKMCEGDTFSCLQFTLGEEATLSNFGHHDSPLTQTYIIGQKHGLTILALFSSM